MEVEVDMSTFIQGKLKSKALALLERTFGMKYRVFGYCHNVDYLCLMSYYVYYLLYFSAFTVWWAECFQLLLNTTWVIVLVSDSYKSHQVCLMIFWLLAFFGQSIVCSVATCVRFLFSFWLWYFHLLSLPGKMPKPDVNHSSFRMFI